jgi:acyl carrier protein
MGLDLMDVVFRLERTFSIKIKRDDLAEVVSDGTVASLYRLILRRLGPNERPRCLGPPVFYHFRRAAADLFGTPSDVITPSSRLADVIPTRDRRRDWHRLREAIDLQLPALRRPPWLVVLMHAGLIASGLLGLLAYFVLKPVGDPTWLALGTFGGIVLKSAAAYVLTLPWAVCFPASCVTVKDLVKTVLRSDYGRVIQHERAWHELEVWYAFQDVFAEMLNIRVHQITADARLVEDLGF